MDPSAATLKIKKKFKIFGHIWDFILFIYDDDIGIMTTPPKFQASLFSIKKLFRCALCPNSTNMCVLHNGTLCFVCMCEIVSCRFASSELKKS